MQPIRSLSLDRAVHRRPQSGTTLIEVMIALAILLLASVGIMSLCAVAMVTTENQGHLMARASEYSQDKMEQLISLAYTDSVSNTATFPTASSGGSGMTTGGSSNPSTPATGYVDYLDFNGNPLPVGGSAPANWYYIRVWQISNPAGAPSYGSIGSTLKQVTVTTKVRRGVATTGGGGGIAPQATMSSLVTYPKP
jgi:hypothetical protein